MTKISNHEMRSGMRSSAATNPSTNWATLAIGIARVKEVQYEELKVTLVVLQGEAQVAEYTGVDITVPCGGKRHFFGALPERGDICYVGWGVRESSGTASAKLRSFSGGCRKPNGWATSGSPTRACHAVRTWTRCGTAPCPRDVRPCSVQDAAPCTGQHLGELLAGE